MVMSEHLKQQLKEYFKNNPAYKDEMMVLRNQALKEISEKKNPEGVYKIIRGSDTQYVYRLAFKENSRSYLGFQVYRTGYSWTPKDSNAYYYRGRHLVTEYKTFQKFKAACVKFNVPVEAFKMFVDLCIEKGKNVEI